MPKISSVEQLAEFQKQARKEIDRYASRVLVCMTGCRARGAVEVGARFRKELAEAGIPVTLMVDAAMRHCVDMGDLVLVGADSFTDEYVVNKTGTGALVLLAREAGKPVYAVCTTQKYLPPGIKLPDEQQHNADEVWADRTGNINIWNKYFETVDIGLFSGIVTEKGLFEVGRLPGMDLPEIHPLLKS